MFGYIPCLKSGKESTFDIAFSMANPAPEGGLPTQAIQRVYLDEGPCKAVVVTMEVPLSAPLSWKTSTRTTRQWTLLEEILHCPDPQKFPMQHRMWRLFHDRRRQDLVREYLTLYRENLDSCRETETFLDACAEQGLYIFDIGRPPRIWTVGGEGSLEAGFSEGSRSSFGLSMFTYEEADVLLLNEAEHVTWAANDNAPKNILIFDEEFNRRRPGKATAQWLKYFKLQGEQFPDAKVDVQLLGLAKKESRKARENDEASNASDNDEASKKDAEDDDKETRLAASSLSIKDALGRYSTFQPHKPISRQNPPTNFLNITDEQVGYWPEGMAKSYTLLRELVQLLEARSFDGAKDTHGKLALGKPGTVVRTMCDIRKSQQFRILAQRGAASDWHMDQLGVYTFVHLEGNLEDANEPVDDVVKYWPSYPLDQLSKTEEKAIRVEFAKAEDIWRPRPAGGIPVLTILKGYLLLQKPGNIHAPITLTECLFLGGMAWKHSSIREHLEVTQFLAANDRATNEELPSQLQPLVLTLRAMIKSSPVAFGLAVGSSTIEEFDQIFFSLYGMVSMCECKNTCATAQCPCKQRNVRCGNRCHERGSKAKCLNTGTSDFAVMMAMGARGGRQKVNT